MNGSDTGATLRDHIDRLRGVFAAGIMLGHAIDLAYGQGAPDYWFQILMPIRPLCGFVWVIGFIVLSGYCVARSCQLDGVMTWRSYVALRASRLFPLLWACLVFAALVEYGIAGSAHRPPVWTGNIDARSFALNVLGLGGFLGTYGSLAPAYTLSYELLFYALWGAAWFGTGRRHAAAVASASVAAIILFVLISFARIPLPAGQLRFALMLFSGWAIGAALSEWLPAWSASRLVRALAPFRWPIVLTVMAVGFAVARMPLFEVTSASAFYYLVLSAAFAFLSLGFAARTRLMRPSWLDRWLGALSYPLFLAHGPVLIGLATFYRRRGVALSFGPYVLALCLPAVLVALVLAVAVDQPVMALRRRLRGQPAPGCDAAATTAAHAASALTR